MDITTGFEPVIGGSNPSGCIVDIIKGTWCNWLDTYVSEAYAARLEGSTPSVPT